MMTHKKAAAGLALGLGLVAATAFAQSSGSTEGTPDVHSTPPRGGATTGGHQQSQQQGSSPGMGQEPRQGGFGQGAQAQPQGREGSSAGIGSLKEAPVPQYWLADATLFIGSAASAANVMSQEENLANVQAPQVLGDQAQFLLGSVNRALNSLQQLQQSAEASDSTAVNSIRAAVGHLVAARGMATQAAESVSEGPLGPTFTTSIRAALTHLAAAERSMANVGRVYGVPHLAAANVCQAGRAAFGAGIGGKGGPAKQHGGKPQPSDKQQQQPSDKQPQSPSDKQQPGTEGK